MVLINPVCFLNYQGLFDLNGKHKTHPTRPWTSQRTLCHNCQTANWSADRKACSEHRQTGQASGQPCTTCTLAYAQVSESCHVWHWSQSEHMTVSAPQTSFLQKAHESSPRKGSVMTHPAELWGNLHEGWAVEEGKAIEEDDNPDDSRRDEQKCVPAQPQVVQGHLFPKVVPGKQVYTVQVAAIWGSYWRKSLLISGG